ncbi:NUDIX hydrolase [Brevibacterium litoralis]|uniref:NUDIX hydrolase n=1 Tax=Brevibacterium litoralis TaxID=3138935 RepID=UPI0032EB4DDE
MPGPAVPALTDFPRPSLAVDTTVFTVVDGELMLLLVTDPDGATGAAGTDSAGATGAGETRLLPGTFVHERERLRDAVLRSQRDKAGIGGREPRQLHVYDDPDRDDRGWVVTVAHLDVVAPRVVEEGLAAGQVVLVPAAEAVPGGSIALPWDHPRMVAAAIERIRREYAEAPDPWRVLDVPFTLGDLRALHEAVLGEELQRDSFRRHMEPRLASTGEMSDGRRGRPSRLFTHV